MTSGKHSPIPINRYFAIHDTVMDSYRRNNAITDEKWGTKERAPAVRETASDEPSEEQEEEDEGEKEDEPGPQGKGDEWDWSDRPAIKLYGYVDMRGGLRVTVRKTIKETGEEYEGMPLVVTVSYSYNVSLAGKGNVFRYDNEHDAESLHKNHTTPHHRHWFEPPGVEAAGSPEDIGEDWPTLGKIFELADHYYWDHLHALETHEPSQK